MRCLGVLNEHLDLRLFKFLLPETICFLQIQIEPCARFTNWLSYLIFISTHIFLINACVCFR